MTKEISQHEEVCQLLRAVMEQKVSRRARARLAVALSKDYSPEVIISQLVELLGEWQEAAERRAYPLEPPPLFDSGAR